MDFLKDLSISLAPVLAAIAAIASAMAVCYANKLTNDIKRFHTNTFLNDRELNLLKRILELLKIYEVWCTEDGAGANVNFNYSKENNYETRDDATEQIPRDVKFLLIRLSSHSERLEGLLSEWERDFINKVVDSYYIEESKIREKIASMRSIVVGGF